VVPAAILPELRAAMLPSLGAGWAAVLGADELSWDNRARRNASGRSMDVAGARRWL